VSTGYSKTSEPLPRPPGPWPSGGQANENPNLTMIMDACLAAGVRLGSWDARIVQWLSMYQPSTCAVIAGLIARAHEAGKATGGDQGGIYLGNRWLRLQFTRRGLRWGGPRTARIGAGLATLYLVPGRMPR
jgi:hypothetical protein